jgi:hypothetical protein
MTEPQQEKSRWPGFKYEPVRGLMGRHISRYLRIQRKNMRRFFTERGMFDLAERLNVIRKDSAMGMLETNRKFQEILNEYSQRTAPQSTAKTDDQQSADDPVLGDNVDMPATGIDSSGSSDNPGKGVPELASQDGAELLIEE